MSADPHGTHGPPHMPPATQAAPAPLLLAASHQGTLPTARLGMGAAKGLQALCGGVPGSWRGSARGYASLSCRLGALALAQPDPSPRPPMGHQQWLGHSQRRQVGPEPRGIMLCCPLDFIYKAQTQRENY